MKKSLGHLGHVVKTFLQQRWDQKNPLLIAYSGGPDSKALLYTAVQSGFPVHVAHVDHGWRPESVDEARRLASEAQGMGVPFHSTRLEKKTTEEQARFCRLAFFRSLCEKYSLQAVLLGHQADDLAETVLKRIFEGASLSRLGGMRPVDLIEGVTIWRPLLQIKRSEIEEWLVKRDLVPLRDASNSDPRYLRARMRQNLMPLLCHSFGKNIVRNLVVLSERSFELRDFLETHQSAFAEKISKGPFGIWINPEKMSMPLLRDALQSVCEQEQITASRAALDTVITWLLKRDSYRTIEIDHRTVAVCQGHFFLLSSRMPQFGPPLKLSGIAMRSGDWVAQECAPAHCQGGWQTLWRGEPAIVRCTEEPVLQLLEQARKNAGKTPIFLRSIIPVLMRGSHLWEDLLLSPQKKGERFFEIRIETGVPHF
jgi:tRNA(Ile)-lysidine synthase